MALIAVTLTTAVIGMVVYALKRSTASARQGMSLPQLVISLVLIGVALLVVVPWTALPAVLVILPTGSGLVLGLLAMDILASNKRRSGRYATLNTANTISDASCLDYADLRRRLAGGLNPYRAYYRSWRAMLASAGNPGRGDALFRPV